MQSGLEHYIGNTEVFISDGIRSGILKTDTIGNLLVFRNKVLVEYAARKPLLVVGVVAGDVLLAVGVEGRAFVAVGELGNVPGAEATVAGGEFPANGRLRLYRQRKY